MGKEAIGFAAVLPVEDDCVAGLLLWKTLFVVVCNDLLLRETTPVRYALNMVLKTDLALSKATLVVQ